MSTEGSPESFGYENMLTQAASDCSVRLDLLHGHGLDKGAWRTTEKCPPVAGPVTDVTAQYVRPLASIPLGAA